MPTDAPLPCRPFTWRRCSPASACCSGPCRAAAYGDPRQRAPSRVVRDVDRGWIDVGTARSVYGVAVTLTANGVDHAIDLGRDRASSRGPQRRGVELMFRIGIDIGGTFTDCVVHTADGGAFIVKSPSTPGAFATGFMNALGAAAGRARSVPRGVARPHRHDRPRHHGIDQCRRHPRDRPDRPDRHTRPSRRADAA